MLINIMPQKHVGWHFEKALRVVTSIVPFFGRELSGGILV